MLETLRGNTDTIKIGDSRTLINHDYAANNGRLTKSTYGNGFYVENVYDSLDRVVGIKYNGSEKYSWEYDYKGRVGYQKDNVNGYQRHYTYDSKDRVIAVWGKPTATGLQSLTFTNEYNAKEQLTKVVRKIGSTTLQTQYSYSDSGRLNKETYNNGANLNYSYDALGRVEVKTLKKTSSSTVMTHSYTFSAGSSSGTTTTRVQGETLSGNGWSDVYGYTYDANGNITAVTKNNAAAESYAYDSLNQLTSAQIANNTYSYSYDNGGNILSKTENGVTKVYGYTDSTWRDLLTSYNGESISYDTIGNPLTYRNGMQFTWQGRQLVNATVNSVPMAFSYNSDGIRTTKTYNGVKTYYTVDGSKIITQRSGSTALYFEYDATGNVASVTNGSNTYYYIRNSLENITGLVDANGNRVVTYTYDPWGKILSTTDTSGTNIGTLNSFRHKGYYYDSETGFYYLNSRYYDPEIGRWINADSLLSQGSVLGNNMFAYCLNNPVNMADTTGELPFFLVTAAIGAVSGAIIGGVVAAKNGGNVWAGIGIGAAAGGLAGAGLGAAAGVVLAGSATASTAAVVSGAGMVATAVSTGGAGAGLALVADNISRAVNNVGTVLYSGGEQARQAATTFANNTGGTTIDPTVIGQVADAATKVPGADFTTVWSQASAAFCHQASGVVNAFVSNSAYRGVDSIFWSVEMPTLLNNPRVTEIIIHIFE